MINLSHQTYRPDIDGLRAIAILAVVIYHSFPGVISGGFVGVDIFFVISGFLISNILFKSLELNTFSYLDFYSRRIKRIFPALIFILLIVFFIGYIVLLPVEFEILGQNVVAGGLFFSNILQWRDVGYFNTDAEFKPLLHLWSLGVEEQYYIFWPILVALIAKRSHNFLLIASSIFVGSFLINIFAVNVSPSATFYLPVTRLWELMLGSLLAYIMAHKINFLCGKDFGNYISFVGILLIIIGLSIIDRDKSFPGYWALLPTFGTFLIILAGNDSWINKKILSNNLFIFIGLISYPLYLWHWPLLVYSKILGLTSVFQKIAILLFSFLLAYWTYLFIEKPLRAGSRYISALLIIAMLILMMLGGLVFYRVIHPLHTSNEIVKISRAISEWDYPGKMESFIFNKRKLYRMNKYNYDPQEVVFFGDSNMEQYYSNIDELRSTTNKTIIFMTQGGCIPIPSVYEDQHNECKGFTEDLISYAQRPEVKTIVISAYWYGYFDEISTNYIFEDNTPKKLYLGNMNGQIAAFNSLEKLLDKLNKMEKKTYLVLNIPKGDALDPKYMINRSLMARPPFFDIKYRTVSIDSLREYGFIDTALINISRRTKSTIIDPKYFLCEKGQCSSIWKNGEPIYKDASHLRPSFVRNNIHFLDRTLE